MKGFTGRRLRKRGPRCYPGAFYPSCDGAYIPIRAYCEKYFCSIAQVTRAIAKGKLKAVSVRKRRAVEDKFVEFGRCK